MEKLNWLSLGSSLGSLAVVYVVFLSITANFGWGGEWVSFLSNVYIGYTPTLLGTIIGAVWGFIDGFIAGALIALFYNFYRRKCPLVRE